MKATTTSSKIERSVIVKILTRVDGHCQSNLEHKWLEVHWQCGFRPWRLSRVVLQLEVAEEFWFRAKIITPWLERWRVATIAMHIVLVMATATNFQNLRKVICFKSWKGEMAMEIGGIILAVALALELAVAVLWVMVLAISLALGLALAVAVILVMALRRHRHWHWHWHRQWHWHWHWHRQWHRNWYWHECWHWHVRLTTKVLHMMHLESLLRIFHRVMRNQNGYTGKW